MAKYKGTNIDMLHQIMKQRGPDFETLYVNKLSPEDAKTFATALTISWIPLDVAARLLVAAAEVLYPGDPKALHKIGYDQALANLKGIYRAVLSIATPAFAIAQTARLWKLHFDTGTASGEQTSPTSGRVMVANLTDFPEPFYEIVGGYIMGIMSFLGLKGLHVQMDRKNPMSTAWNYTWE